MPNLSIIIVSYNTRGLLLEALQAVFATGCRRPFEVIVLDNDSADRSADAVAENFPDVRLFRSEENLGFAKGNNVAAAQSDAEWLLLLNPDTAVYPGALDKILTFAEEHREGGIYGGQTFFPDGSVNIASCWQKPTPWSLFCSAFGLNVLLPNSSLLNPEKMGGWKRDSVRHADIVVGCFLLIRRQLWKELGGFDTTFWMYGEDADLCLRAQRLGYRPMITPDAQLMHVIGASSKGSAAKTLLLYKGRATLIRRHWSKVWQPWGMAMQWLWIFNRLSAARLLSILSPRRFRDTYAKWREVWRQRSDWMMGYDRA